MMTSAKSGQKIRASYGDNSHAMAHIDRLTQQASVLYKSALLAVHQEDWATARFDLQSVLRKYEECRRLAHEAFGDQHDKFWDSHIASIREHYNQIADKDQDYHVYRARDDRGEKGR